ncbi:hypothetical protein M758_UG247000 [Ceratodon purpureus]|nr:hypothetical protein M758_UG247000 [Ceratodon purpureus]
MNGPDALSNFRTCTELGLVCHGWVRDVDGTEEWGKGIIAWHRRPSRFFSTECHSSGASSDYYLSDDSEEESDDGSKPSFFVENPELPGKMCNMPRGELTTLVIEDISPARTLESFYGEVVAEYYDPVKAVDMISVTLYGDWGTFDVPRAAVELFEETE